jgi:catechol 2,3-dioxygenase-like lactoylglutathione lyase family enzyme
MGVALNHTIVWARDPAKSAAFLTQLLGLPEPERAGWFHVVGLANGVSLDYADADPEHEITSQHYAFHVDDATFDAAYQRVLEGAVPYWADPGLTKSGEVYRHHGGRGFYFHDPDGHLLELLTRP